MFGENKNLKDSQKNSLKDTSSAAVPYKFEISNMGFYVKTQKLVTALYMVTDIIDKEEPIRHKLRTLGTEIVSDMHSIQQTHEGQQEFCRVCTSRISEATSFLDIACAMNFISPMNASILKKEFLHLKKSLQEYVETKPTWLIDFFNTPIPEVEEKSNNLFKSTFSLGYIPPDKRTSSKGQTRIGVQKASNLMDALNGVSMSDKDSNKKDSYVFENLKKERRTDILNVIKIIGGVATIKDIKDKIINSPEQIPTLVSCSEKTLQRELMSMVKDHVLEKTGEKRWSRYQVISTL